jgi:hypothetical protein
MNDIARVQRIYTGDEINQMRENIEFYYLWGTTPTKFRENPTTRSSGVFNGFDLSQIVEERLRTYLIAGIEPEELE